MAIKRHVPKFHRATPAVRREALVDATLRCLKRFGHEGVSVRRISAAAGVSIGLINHHFPSKSGLIAETYETLALSLLDSIRRQAENKSVTPRERLSNFFRASFAPEILDPQLFNVWLVFWSMVAHSAEIRAVHFSTYGKYRAVLESLLAQLDGFWVELSLSPTIFKPREAIALCEDWVSALCNGGFPRLMAASAPKKAASSKRR
jgi:TetR/AcrR family transcriptional regulator, transcriptional repressor of bet genes